MQDDGRRYTDQEFALILRMAAEARAPSDEAALRSGDGLTLAEMTQIAAEVGIDASLVEQAADRLPHTGRSARVLGGPTLHRRREVVPASLHPDSFARVVDTIRDVVGQHGEVHEELGRLVWSNVGEVSRIRVEVAPGDGRSEVIVSVDRRGASVLTWVFPVLGGMIGAGIVGAITEPATVAGGVALFAGMATGGLVVARTLWARGTRAMRGKVDTLLRETSRAIAAASGSGE